MTLSVTILISAFVSLTLTPMMCAKLLRHKPPAEQSRFYRASERAFQKVIDFYGRTLTVVLRHQTATLVVAVATLLTTVFLFLVIPKGFFPVQDTGVILGISGSVANRLLQRHEGAPAGARRHDPEGPGVESLSSFIGIDGTNTTINSGRIQINLKPLSERKASATDIIRRLQPELAKVEGITLYLQPVQDLTVEDRVSRTQFQYSLEDPDPKELAVWVPRFLDRLRALPELRDVASDQQNGGLEAHLTLDRTTASRLGITPLDLDNSLYDAFGQRQVSTMFTQLNQYRVVLETQPSFQDHPDDLKSVYLRSTGAGRCPSPRSRRSRRTTLPGRQPPGTIPGRHRLLQPRARRVARTGREGDRKSENGSRHARQRQGASRDRPGVPGLLANEVFLILAAIITVYILLGVLYESYIHPITILSTLPPPPWARFSP